MNEVWRHWCGGSKFKTVEITSRMSSMSPSAHTYVLLRPKILELAKLRLSLAKPSEPCNFDSLAHVGVIVQRHDHNDEDSRELRVLWNTAKTVSGVGHKGVDVCRVSVAPAKAALKF